MRLGIYGGTFDPVHNAHLAVAKGVYKQLSLDEVIFIPAGQPWFKEPVSSAEHRLEMVRLAIFGEPQFSISTIEIERAGPTYSIDTLNKLQTRRAPDALFFIMGWDSFSELPEWKQSRELVSLCRLIVFNRPGVEKPDLRQLEKEIPGISQRVSLLEMPPVDISSTEIRKRVKQGLSIQGMVPPKVKRYIRQHKLYY